MASSLEGIRPASHADSWYEADPSRLEAELNGWLSNVQLDMDTPVKGARVIIAPHAGYSYSGACAAWAYATLDLQPSTTKRIFILGPSHTYYLSGMALSTFEKYATPFGDFTVDPTTYSALDSTGSFEKIPRRRDIEEHSLEMHIPYLWTMLSRHRNTTTITSNSRNNDFIPPIVPILIGDLDAEAEKTAGAILKPYLQDPSNVFIVSSDFCHWGQRFGYQAYVPGPTIPAGGPTTVRRDGEVKGQKIHEAIKVLDDAAIAAVETGIHGAFVGNLRCTKNTVCGRHPIGVMMAGMEQMDGEGERKFKFVRYERSGLVSGVDSSSVSYASAYAVL